MTENTLATLINLMLAPGTRDWERAQLKAAKLAIEAGARPAAALATLEAALRPLAVRDNLTPDVADFYDTLKGEAVAQFDLTPFYTSDPAHQARAIFAGGCFWCMVHPFDQHPGIVAVVSGYTGGTTANPTYEQVQGGSTGHVEAVEIIYDTRVLDYQTLLTTYWGLIDPFDAHGQFQDRGARYQAKIFYLNAAQQAAATALVARTAAASARPVAVEVVAAGPFWPAENRHQDFYRKQPKRYRAIMRERAQLMKYEQLTQRLSR
ncbi:peptide-methionine (S)-S-oxide reductase MsrA [Lacticaseibacillus daqingensis]|uniref:peptide-methionine (S)-S-oxide reductase MsrA n=1 Tax=Lacticaseibacillus daqingensis TaxID=2486014 RepID=UPI000F79636D|nr:peptide-methionine (S)-S-oxide reductase MsrA [Lacticaseibacillus daqingensis]